MGAIGMAESRLNLFAFNPNAHDSTKVTYLWPDVGWLQVNTFWARYFLLNVTYGPLLSPVGNARRARRVWEEAGGLKDPTLGYERWNTYKSEAYNDALPKARLAARAAGEKV